MKKIFFIALVLILASVYFAQGTELVYAHSPIRYVLKNYFSIKNVSTREVVDLEIKVLVGRDDSLHQFLTDITITPEPSTWETDKLGNIYAVVKVTSLPGGKEQQVVIAKSGINCAIAFDESISAIKADLKDFLKTAENKQYLLASTGIESDDALFIADVKELDTSLPVVERAYKIFSYVNTGMTYDMDRQYANTTALSGRKTGRGVCTEFSGVFVALCRANGIPARIVSGYWPQKDFTAGVETTFESSARHSWAEFYVPTVGWVPAEPSSLLTENNRRVVSKDDFAAISKTSRHYVYSYGLEKEKIGSIAVSYSYLGEKTNSNLVNVAMTKESITTSAYE